MLCKYVQSSLHANSSTPDSLPQVNETWLQPPNSISLKSAQGFCTFKEEKICFKLSVGNIFHLVSFPLELERGLNQPEKLLSLL